MSQINDKKIMGFMAFGVSVFRFGESFANVNKEIYFH